MPTAFMFYRVLVFFFSLRFITNTHNYSLFNNFMYRTLVAVTHKQKRQNALFAYQIRSSSRTAGYRIFTRRFVYTYSFYSFNKIIFLTKYVFSLFLAMTTQYRSDQAGESLETATRSLYGIRYAVYINVWARLCAFGAHIVKTINKGHS